MPGEVQRLTDYAAVTEYLYSLKASTGVKFGIDRMNRLVGLLSHPERSYPIIHVAGTNGKGSVSAMLESIFRTAGFKTGLYTSPHLVKLGERVQVNRQILTENEIIAYTADLKIAADTIGAESKDEQPTFFEFMTAMAFLQFQRKQVDVGLIEVGMGGRLDATNVVQPTVSVITSIGLDHCAELGDTHAKIAREKAGIIKPDCPVVIGRLPPDAEVVVREVAAANRSPVYSVRDVFGDESSNYPTTNLEGTYQQWNAATAVLVTRVLSDRFKIEGAAISRGLHAVSWAGRWQRTTVGGKKLILDASHNPEGVQTLEENLKKLVTETGRKPVIVAGALGAFRAKALLDVVSRFGREIHLITPNQARATPFEEMLSLVSPETRSSVYRATLDSVFPDAKHCAVGTADDTVVVTGSIYLLGEVLERIDPGRGEGEGWLQDF